MKLIKPKFWDKKIGIISALLFPLSLIVIIYIFIKRKLVHEKKFKIPIVCVGNIYIGGTGKTPISMFIANKLSELGKKPSILRKYYKSHDDEYNLISNNFKNLIVSRDRTSGLKEAELSNFDMVILDDGLQDYEIKKDLNIVCFNQNQLVGNGLVLPSGPLRESLSALKNTNIVIINGQKNSRFERKILGINPKIDFFYSSYEPTNIIQFKNKRLLAIAGIGNPENFFQLLEEYNLLVEKKLIFPDHHKFSENEIQNIINESKRNNYQIVMTEKDYYKLKKFNFDEIKYLQVKLKIEDSNRLINKIIKLYDKNS